MSTVCKIGLLSLMRIRRKGVFLPLSGYLIGVALAIVLVSLDAGAQCPGGKPPNPDGSCGRTQPKRSSNSSPSTCAINVLISKQGGGEALARVTLALSNVNSSSVVTDANGSYSFKGLACNRDYVVTPAPRTDFVFEPTSTVVKNLKKSASVNFVAIPRERPNAETPAAAPLCKPLPGPPPEIKIGGSLTGKLTPETALCETGKKGYFNAYLLKGAVGGDIVQFDFQSLQSTDLSLQLFDQTGGQLKFESGVSPSEVPIQQLILPKAGDYTLCIVSSTNRSGNYRLSITRKGITEEGYREQLERARSVISDSANQSFYDAFNGSIERLRSFDNIQATDQKIRTAAQILEQLREVQPDRPQALSMLSVINFYYRKDSDGAVDLAIKSLKLGGEGRFKGIFGQKLDRKERRILSNARSGWLIVRNGEVSFEAFGQSGDPIFKSEPQWVSKKSLDIPEFNLGLTIYGRGIKDNKKENEKDKKDVKLESFEFIPSSTADPDYNFPLTEVAVIKALIKRFVQTERQTER